MCHSATSFCTLEMSYTWADGPLGLLATPQFKSGKVLYTLGVLLFAFHIKLTTVQDR